MKRKLNFFCILMLVLMVAQVVISFVLGADAFAEGWRAGRDEGATAHSGMSFLEMITCLAALAGAIVSFVCFFRFILNVNRNKVFVWENVPLLRLTGFGLLIFALMGAADELLTGSSFTEVYDHFYNLLIFCVFNLIVAEVFAIGLKLKEEQDLTI